MADKTLAQKLFIKENYKVLFVNEPEKYGDILGALPANVAISKKPNGQVDFIQVFVTNQEEMQMQLENLKPKLSQNGLFWISYPKGTSKEKTDVNRDIIRNHAMTIGMQAVSLVSVDNTWSAMRLKII